MTLLEIRALRTWLETADGVVRGVDGVDLRLEEGEALGVVGESGSGKTLLALSILGLLPPGGRILEGSSIRFQGRELVGMGGRDLRKIRGGSVGMVFQEPMTSLNPVLRVGVQIGEALEAHRGMTGRAVREESVRLLAEVGITDPEERMRAYPHQLSGGMRQRVLLAMALAGDPALLLADEPTTALDATVRVQILEILEVLRARRRMGLLLISHDPGVVMEVCGRAVVLYGGQVVEAGSVEELFQSPAHPYTRGLLASRPDPSGPGRPLRPVPGEIPQAHRWPQGCRFHPRCPEVMERCFRAPPPLLELPAQEEGRLRAGRCWLLEGEDGR